MESPVTADEFNKLSDAELTDKLYEVAYKKEVCS